MTAKNKNALIIFSRLPIGKETKTRLANCLSENERESLHFAMWKDIFNEVLKIKINTDIFLYWTGSGDIKNYLEFVPASFQICKQIGSNLGEKMSNASKNIFDLGYKNAIIIGSDIPELKSEYINRAFEILIDNDIALGPSYDGGYWLIGMKKFSPDVFNISSWGNSSVLNATVQHLQKSNLTYKFTDKLRDIDTYEDIKNFINENSQNESASRLFLMKIFGKSSMSH